MVWLFCLFFCWLVVFLAGKRINNMPNLFSSNLVFPATQNFQGSDCFEVYRLCFAVQFPSSWYQYPQVSLARSYHSYFISKLFTLRIIICISAQVIKTEVGSVCCAGIAVSIYIQNKRQQKDKAKLQKQSNRKSVTESEPVNLGLLSSPVLNP